jgi:hypothetical protein
MRCERRLSVLFRPSELFAMLAFQFEGFESFKLSFRNILASTAHSSRARAIQRRRTQSRATQIRTQRTFKRQTTRNKAPRSAELALLQRSSRPATETAVSSCRAGLRQLLTSTNDSDCEFFQFRWKQRLSDDLLQ